MLSLAAFVFSSVWKASVHGDGFAGQSDLSHTSFATGQHPFISSILLKPGSNDANFCSGLHCSFGTQSADGLGRCVRLKVKHSFSSCFLVYLPQINFEQPSVPFIILFV